jgi:hypothetical protein
MRFQPFEGGKMKEVTIKTVNETGHSTQTMPVANALDYIQEQTQEHGKWCYVDGAYVKHDKLTANDIASAKDIVLTNALAGG